MVLSNGIRVWKRIAFLQLHRLSSIRHVRSAHTSFRQAIGIVPSRERIKIIVLECLFVFGTLHELGHGILNRLLVTTYTLVWIGTYTSHELEHRDLGVFEKLGDLFE